MTKIIIRADDLGYSEGVNYGIAKTVMDGVVSSVGIMTNMPAIKHGLDLLKDQKVCYGQHTNVCAGNPLSDPKLIPSLVDENGYFKTSKIYREATSSFVVFEEALIEIEAQYNKFLELTGENPHYIEGHAVFDPILLSAIETFAKQKKLKYSGFSPDGSPITIGNTQVKFYMESMHNNYNPLDLLKRMVNIDSDNDTVHMFISHPGYLDAYLLNTSSLLIPRVYEVEALTSSSAKMLLSNQDIKLLTYDDL